jgi:hypothetical protein
MAKVKTHFPKTKPLQTTSAKVKAALATHRAVVNKRDPMATDRRARIAKVKTAMAAAKALKAGKPKTR